jgi:ABC-type tungstate transport system permease subunit
MKRIAVLLISLLAVSTTAVGAITFKHTTDHRSVAPTAIYGRPGLPVILRIDNDSIVGSSGMLRALAHDYLAAWHKHGRIAWYQDKDRNALIQLRTGKVDMAILEDSSILNSTVNRPTQPPLQQIFVSRLVLVGPRANPALLDGEDSLDDALAKIRRFGAKRVAQGGSPIFLSRDDHSAINEKERSFWSHAGFTPWVTHDLWYRCDHVFGRRALTDAQHESLYTITDAATWHSMARRLPYLRLYVSYGTELYTANVAVLRPYPSQHVRSFLKYLQTDRAQKIIARYRT